MAISPPVKSNGFSSEAFEVPAYHVTRNLWRPSRVLYTSNDPLCRTIAFILNGAGVSSSFCFLPLHEALSRLEGGGQTDLLLLSALPPDANLSELIKILDSLRMVNQWRGAILVLTSPKLKLALQQWDFFQLQGDSRIVAQTIISVPPKPVDFLTTIGRLHPFERYAFRLFCEAVKEKDSIRAAWEHFQALKACHERGDWDPASFNRAVTLLLNPKGVLCTILGHGPDVNQLKQCCAEECLNEFNGGLASARNIELFDALSKVMRAVPSLA